MISHIIVDSQGTVTVGDFVARDLVPYHSWLYKKTIKQKKFKFSIYQYMTDLFIC